jgi:hypothetical protein
MARVYKQEWRFGGGGILGFLILMHVGAQIIRWFERWL